jgi:ribosome recycling factor
MIDLKQYEEKMDASIDKMHSELIKIKTGIANPMMFNDVMVSYFDVMTPLTQIANVQAPEPRQLVIKPYDTSAVKEIVAAIKKAELGVDPVNEGEIIRINIPMLTADTRKDYVKKASQIVEEARIAIRNIRRDANDRIKKSKEYTKDDVKGTLEEVQKLTDLKIKQIEDSFKSKEEELLKV